jgi:single-stranded DNA-binding protein
MNDCTIAITVVATPEYRHTRDGDHIAQCLGAFYSPRHNEKDAPPPPSTIKVVAWGENLATQLSSLRSAQQCVIQGRLSMNTIERPEGFREKIAELIAQRIIPL